MDFTETPHAEDFLIELDALVQEYVNRGIKPKTVKWVFEIVSDNMPKKRKPIKKNTIRVATIFGEEFEQEI
jgi:hypothetical protein